LAGHRLENLAKLVRSIPEGCVASYGAVGRALDNPASGLLVGRWMAQVDGEVPWWRVIKADGSLATAKRDPRLADEQTALLQGEGVPFVEGRVPSSFFIQP
jgi:alkylated DNA nucleotide flippase Atl1